MIVNEWTKYHRDSKNPVGFNMSPMDGVLNGTCISGFIPCNAMIVDEENAYERVMDVIHAFSIMDNDGKMWGMDNGLINPLGYEVDVHAQLVLNNFKVVMAWVISWNREGEFRPREAHLIVEMPDSIIRQKHYETGKLCDCNLGKYYVQIRYTSHRCERSYPNIKFWQKTKWYDGQDYYYNARHPHISNGNPCWGDMEMNSYDPLKNGNIFASLGATRVFLKTYNRASPYDPINRWQNEWWLFDLPSRIPNSFIVGGNELRPNSITIPNPNALAINDDGMLNTHIRQTDQFNQDVGAFLAYGFGKLSEGNEIYGMSFDVNHIFNNLGGMIHRMNVMALITRLVLTKEMSWLQALIVSIKILYSEWKCMTANAPKRWPQGTIKKSEYNIIRAWSNRPNESPYYKLPGFYLWKWNGINNTRIGEVTNEDMKYNDIMNAIGTINTIRGRNVAFSFNPHRNDTAFPSDILDKVNDPEYLNMMGFTSFKDSEFPEADPANKRAACKKLRAEINNLNDLYQNARYLQNKRFLTIIEREKEIISNEANNYRPVATKDRLPFESL